MRHSFVDILEKKIEIPIIQRDYAQGRQEKTVDKIRRDFLNALFGAIKKRITSPQAQLELDFIYGFHREAEFGSTFIPIDGQQRLTTLWLLYWFVAYKEQEKVEILSNFVYETRYSSTIFCQELVNFQPEFNHKTIADEIKDQPWYFETWGFDPTIQSMLVMLNDIEQQYGQLIQKPIWSILTESGGPFYFYKLNMDKVGLSDDLYIKMNSRGKPLTEFEYFKASFSEQINDKLLKERFEKSIDQEWTESIWKLILESREDNEINDIALVVDHSFLNLFNYLTGILAAKQDVVYIDTYESKEVLKVIYKDKQSFEFVFDILDVICNQLEKNPSFWKDLFYYQRNDYSTEKCRLFFLHEETSLIKRCLLHYHENRGFTLQEHLLLYICLLHLKNPIKDFHKYLRILRNAIVNSEFQLRNESIGVNYKEVEAFILNKDIEELKTFKTDQLKEEKEKEDFKFKSPEIIDALQQLEDSDLLRGSISIIDFDNNFETRTNKFLQFFDEELFSKNFILRSNVLLSFGDYSQRDGGWNNLMSSNKTITRKFLTTPGFGKHKDVYSKTKTVLYACLDHFIQNSIETIEQKRINVLEEMEKNGRDWRYYFIKYPSFRHFCNKGYYYWFNQNEKFVFNKMKEKQFNGFNWNPFLYVVNEQINSKKVNMTNYNSFLEVSRYKSLLGIHMVQNGARFINLNKEQCPNWMWDKLRQDQIINEGNIFKFEQDEKGTDIEDRIIKLKELVEKILNWEKP